MTYEECDQLVTALWLRETQLDDCVESDYEDLRGQHADASDKVDTREKLEGDLNQLCVRVWEISSIKWEDAELIKVRMYKLLERQAAITERECHDGWCYDCQDAHDRQQYANVERINELQAEIAKRDKGIERLKRRRDELEEELRQVKRKYAEKLADARTLPSVERVRELEDALRVVAAERDELKAEQLSWPTMLQYKEACSERDAYRGLCGRFRKMAQEMANMEVDWWPTESITDASRSTGAWTSGQTISEPSMR